MRCVLGAGRCEFEDLPLLGAAARDGPVAEHDAARDTKEEWRGMIEGDTEQKKDDYGQQDVFLSRGLSLPVEDAGRREVPVAEHNMAGNAKEGW